MWKALAHVGVHLWMRTLNQGFSLLLLCFDTWRKRKEQAILRTAIISQRHMEDFVVTIRFKYDYYSVSFSKSKWAKHILNAHFACTFLFNVLWQQCQKETSISDFKVVHDWSVNLNFLIINVAYKEDYVKFEVISVERILLFQYPLDRIFHSFLIYDSYVFVPGKRQNPGCSWKLCCIMFI